MESKKSFSITRQDLELVCRYYVFIFLSIYGFAKVIGQQFYQQGEIPSEFAEMTLSNADAFPLAWAFMGFSYTYMLFIGISEMLGAVLLLWNRTKLIGVGILIPIFVNVIVFDILFLDAYGALAAAIIYFIMVLTIAYLNKERIVLAFYALTQNSDKSSIGYKKYIAIAVIMAIIFFMDQQIVGFFGHGRG